MFFLQSQNDLLAVGFIRLAGEHETHLKLPLPRVVRGQIKGQVMAIGNQIACLGVDACPEDSWLHLVGDRVAPGKARPPAGRR